MSTKDRILEFIEAKGLNKRQFYSQTGLSNGFLDKVQNIGTDKVESILNNYPELNIEWLVLGKGPMLKKIAGNPAGNVAGNPEMAPNLAPKVASNAKVYQIEPVKRDYKLNSTGEPDVGEEMSSKVNEELAKMQVTMPRVITIDTSGEENVIYVPVKARAGYLSGYTDASFIEQLPAFRLPGFRNGTFRIFEVEGTSMFNTLHDKDKVIARWSTVSEIRDDRVYVLITKNDGVLVKRVINRYQEGKIICKSDNNHKGEWPAIVLDVYDILEIWYVVETWSRQLSPPGEIYKRMVDLEGDVAIMKDMMKQLTKAGLNKD